LGLLLLLLLHVWHPWALAGLPADGVVIVGVTVVISAGVAVHVVIQPGICMQCVAVAVCCMLLWLATWQITRAAKPAPAAAATAAEA
jgi:hypothetical protein